MSDTKRARREATRGFATKTAERQAWLRHRVQLAPTAEAQLAAAYDWFRAEARRAIDGTGVMRDAAQYLADQAARLGGNSQ